MGREGAGGSDLKECVFIVNPAGSNGKNKVEWERLLPAVARRLEGVCRVTCAYTAAPRHAEQLAKEAIDRKAWAVAAVGGDGTVHEVVNGLMQGGRSAEQTPALAVVPLGTGSDFIRTFNWSKAVSDAADRIAAGRTQTIDVGRITCAGRDGKPAARYFANMTSCGASAVAGSVAPSYKFLGDFLCYQLSALHGLLAWRNTGMSVSVDGQPPTLIKDVTMLACGNGQYFGGGMKVVPDASPRDGLLHSVSISRHNLLLFLWRNRPFRAGRHLQMNLPTVRGFSGREVAINTDDPAAGKKVIFEADGEVVGTCPATVQIVPSALRLLA